MIYLITGITKPFASYCFHFSFGLNKLLQGVGLGTSHLHLCCVSEEKLFKLHGKVQDMVLFNMGHLALDCIKAGPCLTEKPLYDLSSSSGCTKDYICAIMKTCYKIPCDRRFRGGHVQFNSGLQKLQHSKGGWMLLITTEFVCVLFGNRLQKEGWFLWLILLLLLLLLFFLFPHWQVSFILRRQGGVSHWWGRNPSPSQFQCRKKEDG